MKRMKDLLKPVSRAWSVLVTCLLTVLWPAVAQAQNAATDIQVGADEQNTWMGYALIVVLAAAVMTINLLPSKRSHQD